MQPDTTSARYTRARCLDVATIETALDGLLRAIFVAEAADREARTGPSAFEFVSIGQLRLECLPTREESAIMSCARDPIGAACRHAIRLCGEHLHQMSGDTSLMHVAIDRDADMEPRQYGARLSIVDSAWNGIGGEWWS